MHRNTYLLVTLLAIFAALLVGVNIGKRFINTTPTPATTPTPLATPTPIRVSYTNPVCGFSLEYPETLTMMGNSTESAILSDASKKAIIAIACQKDIPRPALLPEKIETVLINNPRGGTISAQLYHELSAKDGTPIDELIFRNPNNGIDIFIAGMGETYNEILTTLRLLP